MPLRIEHLTPQHDRKNFDCGVPELNSFLQQQAAQKARKNISQTYVACQDSTPTKIAGYHTITGYSVQTPPAHKLYKNYPHPLNAVKLARLAADQSHQGQGIGAALLVHAICQTALAANILPSIGLFVDPMTENVRAFYEQYGFLSVNSDDPLCLEMWLPISACIEAAKAANP